MTIVPFTFYKLTQHKQANKPVKTVILKRRTVNGFVSLEGVKRMGGNVRMQERRCGFYGHQERTLKVTDSD